MYGSVCTCTKGDFVFKPWLSLEHLSSAAVPALVSGMTLSALILPCRVRLMFLPKPGSAFLWCIPQCSSALGWESKCYQNKTTEGSNVLFCWPIAKKVAPLSCLHERGNAFSRALHQVFRVPCPQHGSIPFSSRAAR